MPADVEAVPPIVDGPGETSDLVVGFKMVRERFTSRVLLHDEVEEHLRIDVTYVDGPFRYLNNHWLFLPHEEGCLIDFYVDFEFHSRLLQKVMQPLFNEAVRRMVAAFEARAKQLYGSEASALGARSSAGAR